MGPTTLTDDVAVLAVVAGLAALAWLSLHLGAEAVRRRSPARPPLPPEDRAPAGLGRLVPVGPQLEAEVRTGVVALELWLLARSRSGRPRRADRPVPRQREPERTRRGTAHGAG